MYGEVLGLSTLNELASMGVQAKGLTIEGAPKLVIPNCRNCRYASAGYITDADLTWLRMFAKLVVKNKLAATAAETTPRTETQMGDLNEEAIRSKATSSERERFAKKNVLSSGTKYWKPRAFISRRLVTRTSEVESWWFWYSKFWERQLRLA